MAFTTKFQCAPLVERLLSPDVQVQLPACSEEVPAKLTATQVAKVFTDHVPGVQKFLFRQQRGQYVLKFMQMAYQDGWSAFRGTALHDHLKWLMRLIVHYGYEGKPGASQYLSEVAEAFMDCQAVQARVVERIGLQIQGVTTDFRGLVMALAGEYKTMAVKMLASDRIRQGKAHDDPTPTHYENRLTADLGQHLGLNADDVRRAGLDEHARARFAKLRPADAEAAAARARELFDVEALLQALVSELNSFSATSAPESLPRLFLEWASQNMTEKHIVFDEATFTHIDVDCVLVMAVLEKMFLGELTGTAHETYRGVDMERVFDAHQKESSAPNCTNDVVVNNETDLECCTNDVVIYNETDSEFCTNDVVINNETDLEKANDKVSMIIQSESKVSAQDGMGVIAVIGALVSSLSVTEIFGNFLETLWPRTRSTTLA